MPATPYLKSYFSVQDINDYNENSLGLKAQFKSFLQHRGVRANKSARMKIKGIGGDFVSVPVSFYNIDKIEKEISSYIEANKHKMDRDKKEALLIILELIRKKQEKIKLEGEQNARKERN